MGFWRSRWYASFGKASAPPYRLLPLTRWTLMGTAVGH